MFGRSIEHLKQDISAFFEEDLKPALKQSRDAIEKRIGDMEASAESRLKDLSAGMKKDVGDAFEKEMSGFKSLLSEFKTDISSKMTDMEGRFRSAEGYLHNIDARLRSVEEQLLPGTMLKFNKAINEIVEVRGKIEALPMTPDEMASLLDRLESAELEICELKDKLKNEVKPVEQKKEEKCEMNVEPEPEAAPVDIDKKEEIEA